MSLEMVRKLYDYHRWANRRLFDVASTLGEEVVELGILPDRRLQRQGPAGRLENQAHLLRGHPRALSELFRGRLPSHLVDQVTVHPGDPVQRLDHVNRNPDRARVVGNRSGDRLADPPSRVRRELKSVPILEPVDGLHEPDVAFLDQVEQGQVAPEIPLGDRHDQTQVRLHQLALGLAHRAVAALDLLEERAEVPARQPDQTLERAAFARRGRSAAAADVSVELAGRLPAGTHLNEMIGY